MDSVQCYDILVVDDNPAIHEDFKKILLPEISKAETQFEEIEHAIFPEGNSSIPTTHLAKLPNLKIDSAFQGDEALDLIRKKMNTNGQYSVIFVDIRMPPGLNGVETSKKIWEIDPEVQVVLCSAYSDYSWEEIASLLGETDNLLVLKKPFDVIEARQITSALVKKWRITKEINFKLRNTRQTIDNQNRELENYLSLIRATIESTTDGIVIFNNEGKVLDFNKKFLDLWQIDPSSFEHHTIQNVVQQMESKLQDQKGLEKLMSGVINGTQEILSDRIKLKNDIVLEYHSRVQYLKEQVVGRVWSFRDVTEYINMQANLAYQATHDQLTGLANRYLMMDRLIHSIETARREKHLCAVFFIDIDRFKNINDTLGHEAGDKILAEVAERLKKAIRNVDFVTRISVDEELSVEQNKEIIRMGGDEFLLIFKINSKSNCAMIYNRIKENLEEPIIVQDQKLNIIVSIGVSLYPNDADSAEKLLEYSDIAMYRSKKLGGNCLQFYSKEMTADFEKRMQLEFSIKQALKNNEFILEYQPEIDLNTGEIVTLEALIRWKHPRLGLVPPLDFIPVAEEIGLIDAIGAWVSDTACKEVYDFHMKNKNNYKIAINLSAQEFRQVDITERLKKSIANSKLSPECIEIEITESVVIENYSLIDYKLKKLRDLGVKIVIDDFGTGYSSLSYLSRIPVDKIKIDRSFVQTISDSEEFRKSKDNAIIRSIIALSKSMNIPVLAEGIENLSQLQYLRELKCDEGQGYYIQRPCSIEKIGEFFKDGHFDFK